MSKRVGCLLLCLLVDSTTGFSPRATSRIDHRRLQTTHTATNSIVGQRLHAIHVRHQFSPRSAAPHCSLNPDDDEKLAVTPTPSPADEAPTVIASGAQSFGGYLLPYVGLVLAAFVLAGGAFAFLVLGA